MNDCGQQPVPGSKSGEKMGLEDLVIHRADFPAELYCDRVAKACVLAIDCAIMRATNKNGGKVPTEITVTDEKLRKWLERLGIDDAESREIPVGQILDAFVERCWSVEAIAADRVVSFIFFR